MMQSISLVTLGVADLSASSRFYQQGFGLAPAWQNEEIVFYQLSGLILATFLKAALEADMNRPISGTGGIALAHNVGSEAEVQPAMDALLAAGGTLLRAADAPSHGGFRGYLADPDGHAWEIAWQPSMTILDDGRMRLGS